MPIPSARSGAFPTGPPAEVVEQLLARVGRIPGVESAAVVNVLPLGDLRTMTGFRVAGQPEPAREEDRRIAFSYVSSSYFSTMRIRLVRGRTFTDQDREGAPRVGMINESAARRFFPEQDPVGQFLIQGPGSPPMQIVGVVQDIKLRLLDDEGGPFLFLPYLQAGRQRLPASLVVRTTTAPLGKVALVRDEVRAVTPEQVIPEIRTMEQRIATVIADRRVLMVLLGCLAAVALAIAAAGVFGSISYTVSRRTHEIGVRVALGAQPADVLRMVVGQALLQVLIGIASGAAGAVVLTRFLATRLYGVTATDPVTFASVSALLLVVAASAGYIPARRATSVDPVLTLRNE